MSERRLQRAREDAAAARLQLLGEAHALYARLRPASIAGEVWDTVRERGEIAADRAKQAVADRPVVASAAALGIVALLVRKPLGRLFARLRAKPAPAKPKPRARTSARRRTGEAQ